MTSLIMTSFTIFIFDFIQYFYFNKNIIILQSLFEHYCDANDFLNN